MECFPPLQQNFLLAVLPRRKMLSQFHSAFIFSHYYSLKTYYNATKKVLLSILSLSLPLFTNGCCLAVLHTKVLNESSLFRAQKFRFLFVHTVFLLCFFRYVSSNISKKSHIMPKYDCFFQVSPLHHHIIDGVFHLFWSPHTTFYYI